VSPRRFDGWEPREAHVYHYDEAGRVEWVEVQREAEWSQEDRDQLEALVLFESLTCKGCGGWLPHTTSKDFAGVVEHGRCFGCQSLAINERTAEAEHKDEKPTPGRPFWTDGLRMSVRAATAAEKAAAVRPE